MNAMMLRVVSKIHELTSEGVEYPEAEWLVIQNMGCKPAGARILAAYNRYVDEFDNP
jgi:hypothetical protein